MMISFRFVLSISLRRQNSRTATRGFDQPLFTILAESATPPASQGVSNNAHVGIAGPTPDAAKCSTAQHLFAAKAAAAAFQ
jgi:hypothetical protein